MAKKSKYGSKKTSCKNGHIHDSAKEAARCDTLHRFLAIGKIKGLEIQREFVLIPARKYSGGKQKNGMQNERALKYRSDFVYYLTTGQMVVEDCKGYRTKEYIQKRKMFKDKYVFENPDVLFWET